MPSSRPHLLLALVFLLAAIMPSSALTTDSLSVRLTHLNARIEQDGKDYEALLERGRALLAGGQYLEANHSFNEALFSDSPDVRARARMGIGDTFRARPNRKWQAIREYRLAMKADSTYSGPALYEIAQTAFALGWTHGYNVACDALTRLVCIDPGYRDGLEIWWTRIFTQTDDELREVCASLEQKIQSGDENPLYFLQAARIRSRLNQAEETLSLLEGLESVDPDYKATERLLISAECLLDLGDTLGFEESYNRSLESAEEEDDFGLLFSHAEALFNPTEKAKRDSLETAREKAAFFHVFWKRRDPDPTTDHNERLLEHYWRLHKARKEYTEYNAHSLFNSSESYFRLINNIADTTEMKNVESPYFDTAYSPMLWWDNCRPLGLQQRGLFYIRHGEPDMLYKLGLPWDGDEGPPPPYEAWRYGSSYYLFTRNQEPNRPSGSYWPKSFNGAGNIMSAMRTETFKDPLPPVPQANYGVDFKAEGGRLEVEFYNSIPVALDTVQLEAREATVVIYDDKWNELMRRDVTPSKVSTGRDSMWLAVNSVTLDPVPMIYAIRMEVPGHRAVIRRMIDPAPYEPDGLDMSGFVLGSPPPPGVSVHNRRGINLLPRPSLAFRHGERIAVYIEVYGLAPEPTAAARSTSR